MIKAFKIIGWLEGISLLLLLFVAMPVKYLMDNPQLVKTIGPIHGALFVIYVLALIQVYSKKDWNFKVLGLGFILSSVPFGTFYFEKKYL